jgi:pilus assembly protein TadC
MNLAVLVAVVAIGVLLSRPGSPWVQERRLASLRSASTDRGRSDPSTSTPAVPTGRPAATSTPVRAFAATCVAALTASVLDGPVGWGLAVLVACVAFVVTGRLEPASVRRRSAAARAELPYAADLLAVCLDAGASLDRALHVVGEATGGVLGEAFARSAAVLALGAPVAEAVRPWRSDPALVALERLATLMVRSAESGTALAAACARLAADERDARRWRVDVVARQVAIRATAPLGLCFLPAFVLLAIVPVVVAGASTVAW